MILYSVGATSIGMMNPTTGLITNLFNVGNTTTSYKTLSMYNNNITDVAVPTNANDADTKTYVDSNALLQSHIKTVTGTITTAMNNIDQVLVAYPTGKTPNNKTIIKLDFRIERVAGEWFSVFGPYVGLSFGSTCTYFKESNNSEMVYFISQPSTGWTKMYIFSYVELPDKF